MGTAIVFGALLLILAGVLLVLLRSIDMADLRAHPDGVISLPGLVLVVGLGFLVGLGYGTASGIRSDVSPWMAAARGLLDGLLMACAAAFYVGLMQRRQRGRSGPPDAPSGGPPRQQGEGDGEDT